MRAALGLVVGAVAAALLLCALPVSAHDGAEAALVADKRTGVDPSTTPSPSADDDDGSYFTEDWEDDGVIPEEPKLANTPRLIRQTSFRDHKPKSHLAWEGGEATVRTRPGLLRRMQSLPGIREVEEASEFVPDDTMGTAYAKLERDMHVLREPDLARAIHSAARRHGISVEDLAALVLAAAGYGDIRALPEVLGHIVGSDWALWTDLRSGCMADMLVYLARKVGDWDTSFKTNVDDPAQDPTHALKLPYAKSSNARASELKNLATAARRDPVVLLDEVMLRRMESNAGFRRALFDITNPKHGGAASIAGLYGYVGGLNMFQQLNFQGVIRSLAERLRSSQAASPKLPLLEHIDAILKKPVEDAVARLYEEFGESEIPAVNWVHVNERDGNDEVEDNIYGRIVAQLMPKLPTEGDWYSMLDGLEECQADAEIGRTLAQRGRFFRKIAEKIAESGFEYDYIYVPIEDNGAKSYQAAALTFLMSNPSVDPNILRSKAELAALPDKSYTFLLLDDYAGSGMSLMDSVEEITNAAAMAVAPLVQAAQAKTAFEEINLTSFPGDDIDAGSELKAWMGQSGFGKGRQFVAMAYMSPDNNCAFAAMRVAPLFVLDEKGIKGYDSIPPMCSAEQALRGVFEDNWVMTEDKEAFRARVDVLEEEEADFNCVGYVMQWYCSPVMNKGLAGLGLMEDWSAFAAGPSVDPRTVARSARSVPWRGDVKMARPTEECVSDAIDKMVRAGLLVADSNGLIALPMARNQCSFFRLDPGEEPTTAYRFLHDQLKLGALYGIDESRVVRGSPDDGVPAAAAADDDDDDDGAHNYDAVSEYDDDETF